MVGNGVVVDSATQTSDIGSDDEETYIVGDLPNASPRVVIDTSQPFESVEEAVIRFGGRGFWIPGSYLAVDANTVTDQNEMEESDVNKLENKAAEMLKNLQIREKETYDILKELEFTKQLVEELKLKLPKEADESLSVSCISFDEQISTLEKETVKNRAAEIINSEANYAEDQSSMCPSSAAGIIMMELKQAKLNLYQNNNELAAIRSSVESLSKKLEKEKGPAEKSEDMQNVNALQTVQQKKHEKQDSDTAGKSVNPLMISRELRELNHEADQFMKTAEAARSEVLRAMSDVEQTKTGLKVIEMRWLTAKKLEEAARAAESLALAEIRALSYNDSIVLEDYHQQKPCRVSLSLEEYTALTDKARKAESLFRRPKDFDQFRRIEEATGDKFSQMSLEDVLGRVDVMNRRKRSSEQALRRLSSASAHRQIPECTESNFRNSLPLRPRRDPRLLDSNEFEYARNEPKAATRPTTMSIGDILSRKLVMRDDLEVGRQEADGAGRPRVSLNQMLRRHRGESTSPQRRREKGDNEPKHFFSKRKALRFVHISLPLPKHSKNKINALNLW